MKKQGPRTAVSNAPGWLLISGFVLGGAVPAAVGGMLLVYFASQLAEVRSPSGITGVVVFCLVFGTATVLALAVGVKAIVYCDVEAARYLALLTGVAAILTGIGVAYDYSITGGWTSIQIMVAALIVYYLFTSCVVYSRLSVVLAKDEGSDAKPTAGRST
jgi:hypothetical protein